MEMKESTLRMVKTNSFRSSRYVVHDAHDNVGEENALNFVERIKMKECVMFL